MAARLAAASFLDRYPDLDAAHSGDGIKLLAVELEFGCGSDLTPRFRKPLAENCEPGTSNLRNVIPVEKHCVLLLRNSQASLFGGKPGEVGHLDTGNIFRVALVVAVAQHAVCGLPDLPRNMPDMR